jgi:hypothetical protein
MITLLLTLFFSISFFGAFPEPPSLLHHEAAPDYLITQQSQADKKLLAQLEPFFLDGSYHPHTITLVRSLCIKTMQAQPVELLTKDGKRLSALYITRPNAEYNLICISGYIFQATPPKEWGCSLAYIFENANVLLFDWRGLGESTGYNGFFWKNDFGTDAWFDIQAAVDFCKNDNTKPIVTLSFCLGASMLLYAIQQAKLFQFQQPDIIIMNGLFDRFEGIFNRMGELYAMPFYSLLISIGLGKYALNTLLSGSLEVLNPIELVETVTQPILLQLLENDPFVTLQEGLSVYAAIKSYKELCISTIGKHVRLHQYAPAQFKESVDAFLATTLAQAPVYPVHVAK